MLNVSDNIQMLMQKIRDYQKYVMLNRRFIHELEEEGGETSELKKDVAEIEAKIRELQLKCRAYH